MAPARTDPNCIEVLHQIQAVKAGLETVKSEELAGPSCLFCLAEAIASGDLVAQRAKLDEIVDLFDKTKR